MKKGILMVLLILLAFTVWSVLVFGKAKQEEPTNQPTQIQKAEPGPEAFPAVVLPKAKPTKPTMEDFQKLMFEKKGITPEMLEQMKPSNVPVEGLEAAEKEPLTLCTIANQIAPCCYRSTPDNTYLRCWGAVGTATYLNPEDSAMGLVMCPQPVYPFKAISVAMAIYTDDTATVLFQPEIRSVVYIDGCPYPGDPIITGPVYQINLAGGSNTTYLSLGDTVCLYGPWFAVMYYLNTDDRYDPVYCPTGNTIPTYQSWIFDGAGRLCQSYWSSSYYPPGSWFDVVENGLASGAIRVRTRGYNKSENGCVKPPDPWYFKDPYPPGAPCGVPDFNQYQMIVPAFCGPTAGANSIWWFASREDFSLDGIDVPTLISEIATASNTDPDYGTQCDSLEAGILQVIKAHGGWWFTETTVYKPDFWYLQKQLKKCEDVILLLGFWQEESPGVWKRFGGHFVTLAGVDIYNYAFAFSDPAKDNFEFGGGPGQVCGTHTPANDPVDHNSGITSYDYYFVAWPSSSPGGLLYLPDYVANWPTFQDQNFRPQHQPNHGTFNPSLPVHVEIEQAIVVSPGSSKMSGTVESSKAYETENNQGGIEAFGVDFGAGLQSGLYYGSLVVGTSQTDLTCDYGDYSPLHTFKPLGPPVVDTFIVSGAAGDYTIQQLTLKFAHPILPLEITKYAFGFWVPNGGVENCEYAIEDVFVFHNTSVTDITGLQTGMWCDFDISSGGTGDLAGYDQQHNSVWMYDSAIPTAVFGFTKKPHIVGDVPITGYGLSQADRVYDGQYVDSLKYWMENLGWGIDNPITAQDKSIIIADGSFDLSAGAIRAEKWLKWGYGDSILTGGDQNWRRFLYDILHQEGYFRGDVNGDKKLSLGDIVYLINYAFKTGPQPYEFIDQGDVNNDDNVDLADIVYLINYLFKHGPAPIDKNRFLIASPYVDSTHKALGIRNPGLFGEPAWMKLGR